MSGLDNEECSSPQQLELDVTRADACTRPRARAAPAFDKLPSGRTAAQLQSDKHVEDDFRDYTPNDAVVRPAAQGCLAFESTSGHTGAHVVPGSGDVDAGVYQPRCAGDFTVS